MRTAVWTGTQWKEIENDDYLDYEDEDWLLPNRTEREMQAGRSWTAEKRVAK